MTKTSVVVALCLVAACGRGDGAASGSGVAVEQAALAGAECENPNPALFAKESHPFGASMESWAERWWAWAWAIPFAKNPNLDPNADCDIHQDGPLFFLPHLLT